MEKVYGKAMVVELQKLGLNVIQEKSIKVYYDGEVVGEYYADLLVEDAVIVELKAGKSITEAHQAQLLNYLKATQYEVGLLFNFGPEASFKRKIYDNERKGSLSWVEN